MEVRHSNQLLEEDWAQVIKATKQMDAMLPHQSS